MAIRCWQGQGQAQFVLQDTAQRTQVRFPCQGPVQAHKTLQAAVAIAAVDLLFNLVLDLDVQVALLLETTLAFQAVVPTQRWFVPFVR